MSISTKTFLLRIKYDEITLYIKQSQKIEQIDFTNHKKVLGNALAYDFEKQKVVFEPNLSPFDLNVISPLMLKASFSGLVYNFGSMMSILLQGLIPYIPNFDNKDYLCILLDSSGLGFEGIEFPVKEQINKYENEIIANVGLQNLLLMSTNFVFENALTNFYTELRYNIPILFVSKEFALALTKDRETLSVFPHWIYDGFDKKKFEKAGALCDLSDEFLSRISDKLFNQISNGKEVDDKIEIKDRVLDLKKSSLYANAFSKFEHYKKITSYKTLTKRVFGDLFLVSIDDCFLEAKETLLKKFVKHGGLPLFNSSTYFIPYFFSYACLLIELNSPKYAFLRNKAISISKKVGIQVVKVGRTNYFLYKSIYMFSPDILYKYFCSHEVKEVNKNVYSQINAWNSALKKSEK